MLRDLSKAAYSPWRQGRPARLWPRRKNGKGTADAPATAPSLIPGPVSNDSVRRALSLVGDTLELTDEELDETAAAGVLDAWDSLGHVRIVLALEKCLGHELTPDLVAELTTIRDIAALLESEA